MELNIVLFIGLILFFSATIRTTFGFGAGLTAMPLLLLLIDIKIAAPIVAVMSMSIALYIILRDRQSINFKESWKMILFAMLGVPIGLFLLQDDFKNIVCIFLGVVVVLFSIFKLVNPKLLSLKNDKLAPIFCFFSGILGGAYNVNGPPVVIYGTMRGWHPVKFRALMQAIFLPLNITIIIGHLISGNFSPTTLFVLSRASIAIILGVVLGTYLHKKIDSAKFIKIIYILLIGIGINLIIKYI